MAVQPKIYLVCYYYRHNIQSYIPFVPVDFAAIPRMSSSPSWTNFRNASTKLHNYGSEYHMMPYKARGNYSTQIGAYMYDHIPDKE